MFLEAKLEFFVANLFDYSIRKMLNEEPKYLPDDLIQKITGSLVPAIETMVSKKVDEQKQHKEFLTRQETADFFSISLVCLHDWMKKGIVTPLKCGNRTYFHRPSLVKQLLDSNRKDFSQHE